MHDATVFRMQWAGYLPLDFSSRAATRQPNLFHAARSVSLRFTMAVVVAAAACHDAMSPQHQVQCLSAPHRQGVRMSLPSHMNAHAAPNLMCA